MRRYVIDIPAAIVDGTVRAVLWLDAQVTFLVVLLSYAYWITVATVMVFCALVIALWLAFGTPVPVSLPVLPRGPRA